MQAMGVIAAVAETGDMALVDRLTDELFDGGQGIELTDEEIQQFMALFRARLRDTGLLIRALSQPDPGPYDLLMQNISPRERQIARKFLDAWHDSRR